MAKLRSTSFQFLIAAGVVLAVGLSVPNNRPGLAEVWLDWPGSHVAHGVLLRTVSYFVAAMFVGFACIHAIKLARLSDLAKRIHAWLSICGTGLALAGYLGFRAVVIKYIAQGVAYRPSQVGLAGVAFCDIFGLMAFLVGQVLFLVAFARALIPAGRKQV